MNRFTRDNSKPRIGPTGWLTVAVAALLLCSCRTLTPRRAPTPVAAPQTTAPQTATPQAESAVWIVSDQEAEPEAQQAVALDNGWQTRGAVRRVDHQSTCDATERCPAPPRVALRPTCPPVPAATYAALPPQPYGGDPNDLFTEPGPGPIVPGAPLPWAPPGLPRPWPTDEYVHDGGDEGRRVLVGPDWTVRGLDLEDTIAHFDTVDGRTEVTPSNRVHIYAPRFASVRKVTGIKQDERHLRVADVHQPMMLQRTDELQVAANVTQPLQPNRQIGSKSANVFRERQLGLGVDNLDRAKGVIGDALPYEAPYLVQRGEFIQADKARLAEGTTAATAWTDKKAVQVTLDGREASVFTGDTMLESVFTYVLPPGKPRLRVVKMASKHDARPGETVDFTIRFDNVGDQPLGNVTLMDNLSTRLEFVPDTAQCSVDAAFSSGDNEGESLVLRWEIADPLKVGEGGVIRFQCRVR